MNSIDHLIPLLSDALLKIPMFGSIVYYHVYDNNFISVHQMYVTLLRRPFVSLEPDIAYNSPWQNYFEAE